MDDDQQFCLRWNNHQSTLISVFDTLLERGVHVDCTLAAEGQTLKAHKVVLSACSPYFESVLSQQYDKHPIIILKDVKYAELRAMMDYMYRGEVNISQDQLAALLKAAESLQIKGLSDNKPARPQAAHAPRHPSPVSKGEGSICSREGSTSPSRRRKKARRASSETAVTPGALPLPAAIAGAEVDEAELAAELKTEEGGGRGEEGVEDLTIEDEGEEFPAHNDVVRNFQWHMERSQDELMNADGARDNQGSTAVVNIDQPVIKQKDVLPENASTFAVLQNVIMPNEEVMSSKFDAIEEKEILKLPILPEERDIPMEGTISEEVFPVVDVPIEFDKVSRKKDIDEEKNEEISEVKVPKRRGRPPVKRDVPKGKALKSGQSDNLKEKSTTDTNITTDKYESTDTTQNIKKEDLDAKRKLFDYGYYPTDPTLPLPCSEYKTDKGYKCPNCQRCYNARKNLVRHISLECGQDPQFQCPHCPYSKHRRNELKKHIQKKHPGEPDKAIRMKL